MRITHSQTKDCRRSILAPSVSIRLFVRLTLSIPPASSTRHLSFPLGSFISTLWQAHVTLGRERAAGAPWCACTPRSRGASPAAAVIAAPPRARGESGAAPDPPWGWSGPELTEQGSRDGGQGRWLLEHKTPRFSRIDELLWGRGTALHSPPLPASDEWARRMDSPECVISSSNCETPPFTNNLSQLYRTHTETKGKPLPCSLPLASPVRRALFGQGARGRGTLAAEKFPWPLSGLFPLGCPRTPPFEGPRPPFLIPRPLSPILPCQPRDMRWVVLKTAGLGRAESTPKNRGFPGKIFSTWRREARAGEATRFPWVNGGETTKARPGTLLQPQI